MALRQVEDARMARKRHTAEEIVAKLRQVDELTAQGRPVAEAVRAIGAKLKLSGVALREADHGNVNGSGRSVHLYHDHQLTDGPAHARHDRSPPHRREAHTRR